MDYSQKYGQYKRDSYLGRAPVYSSRYQTLGGTATPSFLTGYGKDPAQDRFRSGGFAQYSNSDRDRYQPASVSEFDPSFKAKTMTSPNSLLIPGEKFSDLQRPHRAQTVRKELPSAAEGPQTRERDTQTTSRAIEQSTQTEEPDTPTVEAQPDFRLLIEGLSQQMSSQLGAQNELIRKLENKLDQKEEQMGTISESIVQLKIDNARKDEKINQLEKKADEKQEQLEEMKRLLYNLEGQIKNFKPTRVEIEREDVDGPEHTLAKAGKLASSSEFDRDHQSLEQLQQPKTKLQDVVMKSTFDKDYSECIIQPEADFFNRREERRPPSIPSPGGLGGVVQMGRFHSQLTGKNTMSWHSGLPAPQLPEPKSSITTQQRIDMVFLFADPLVIPSQAGAMLDYDVRLDLDSEYEQIQESLANAGKNFSLKREAISIDTLSQVITQYNPKIIHISCHGSYDELKDNRGQFYLSIENQNADGAEYRLSQARLESILKPYKQDSNKAQKKHGIKLAFVSACQSEEIGKIFFEAGIPVVIAVNANQGIMDSACRTFSSQFYRQLLLGLSIKEAFDVAREHVRLSDCGQYETCCCAHAHKDDCVWYKLFQKDPKRAHEMHSTSCACKKMGNAEQGSFQRQHRSTCGQFQRFLKELGELSKEFKPAASTESAGILGGTKLGGLLDEDDLEEDGIFALEEEVALRDRYILPAEPTEHDLTMCCCMNDMPHDESMKFVLKSRSEEDLELKLFKYANAGSLKQIDNRDAPQMYYKIDKNQLAGRQEQIHEILKFLNGSKEKRILAINGERGQGCSHLAKFSVKYIMDRGFIKHGAYYIDAEKIISEAALARIVKKKLDVTITDFESILQLITKKDMVFCFDNCTKLMQHDADNFLNFLHNFLELTIAPKILLVTNLSNPGDLESVLEESRLKNEHVKLQIENLRRESSVKIIFQMCQTNAAFIAAFPTVNALSEHKLFNEEFQFSPATISEIGMLIYEGMSIDEIYEKQKKLYEEKKEPQESSLERSRATMSELVYAKLLEQRADVINLVNILSFAPEGLLLFDIIRIVYLSQQEKANHECLRFGDWLVFLNDIVGQGPQSDPKRKTTKQELNAPEYESLESKIIFEKNPDNINQKQFQVNPRLQDIIKSIILKENNQISKQYLRYMSVLSRQLIRDIKASKDQDFDPHIVSAQIDSGVLWSEPASQEGDLRCPDWQAVGDQLLISKDDQIPAALQHFWFHEQNFQEILDKYRQYIDDNGQPDGDCVDYLSEICINIPSIYLMLQRESLVAAAEQSIQKAELICNNRQEFSLAFAKIKLMQASLKLKYEKDVQLSEVDIILDDCRQLFGNCTNREARSDGLAEVEFIYGLYHIKKLKQISRLKDAPEAAHGEERKRASLQATHDAGTTFEHARESLEKKCDRMFSEGSVASAKTWLIMAELVVDVAEPVPRLSCHVPEKLRRTLLEKLPQKMEDLREDCHLLCVRSMFYVAAIAFKLGAVKECLKYVTQCISFSKDLGLNDIQQRAQALKGQVHETEINNNFVFAKSSTLVNPDPKAKHHDIILQSQLQDDQLALKAVLAQTGRQINVQFEVLTIELLERIREVGCKILHLSPCMFEVQQDQTHLIVEDKSHRLRPVTPQCLQSLLAPQHGPLKVALVVIDMINCEQFVQVFKELGVPHVVSFQIGRQQLSEYLPNKNLLLLNSSAQSMYRNHVLPQILMMQANDFFVEFALKFYLLVAQNSSVSAAVLESQRAAESSCSRPGPLLKAVLRQQHQEKLGFEDKLFNTSKTKLIPGQVLDISELRAQTNAQMDKYETRYVVQNAALFVRLFEAVFDPTSSNGGEVDKSPSSTEQRSTTFHKKMLNVYGQRGVGKTRLVSEFVRHIHYRYMFQGGIYECDLKEMQTFEEIHEILNEYIESKGSARASSEALSQAPQSREQKQGPADHTDEILLIFDNCDEFVQKNKTQFELQLNLFHQKFKNLQIIFISNEKLDQVFSFTHLQVTSMTHSESLLLVSTLNVNLSLSSPKMDASKLDQDIQQELAYGRKLYDTTQGNPQLIKLFNMINFYGLANAREDLLEQVVVQPLLDKKKRELESGYQQVNKTSYLEETLRSVMSSQRPGATKSRRRGSAHMVPTFEPINLQKTMGIKQQAKYQASRLARFEQDHWSKRLKLSNTFEQIQREAQKSIARTLRLKNNFNFMRQYTNIGNTVNEQVIKKHVPHPDNLSLSRSRSSHSKMTMQKNVSTQSKKDDNDNMELPFTITQRQRTKEVIEQPESAYGSDDFDVVSEVFANEDSECPKLPDDQSQDPQYYNEFEDSMRSKLKEDHYGTPDQEFQSLVCEAQLKPNGRAVHLKIINMPGKDENPSKLPIQLLSLSRVQIYEEAAAAEADPLERSVRKVEKTSPSKNWLGTDSLEQSQRIVQAMVSGQTPPVQKVQKKAELVELPAAKVRDIDVITIYVDKSLYDQIQEQKQSSGPNSSRRLSELLNNHVIHEEDDSVSSQLSNHLVSINRQDVKLGKERSYYSYLSQGPPSHPGPVKFQRERNQYSQLVAHQQELSFKQPPKITGSSQEFMVSAECASAQPVSSHERNSSKKSKPMNKQDAILKDIKAGTFVPEAEDEEPYIFDCSSSVE